MFEKMYYFYTPDDETNPVGVMESLLKEDFLFFYDQAINFYLETYGIEVSNLQLTTDMNKAFKGLIEESPKRKTAKIGSTSSA